MSTQAALRREFSDLSLTALQAVAAVAPGWFQSLFGDWRSWIPPFRERSEFTILNPLRPDRVARYLAEVAVPGVWRPTGIFKHPDPKGDYDSHPDEKWFFINGVLTTRDVARINADLLAHLFGRPMTVVHNSTNSLPVDLLESAVGKASRVMTEPARVAYPLLLEALKDPCRKRVIVVCHSQGTIIMASLLRALGETKFRRWLFSEDAGADAPGISQIARQNPNKQWLGKLEIYAFSNCADRMVYAAPSIRSENGRRVPWIESFANQYDAVARLGMLAPDKPARGIQIDGAGYLRKDAWGHLLNQHYLFPIQDYLSEDEAPPPFEPLEATEDDLARPRLYDYFAGAKPDPY